MTSAQRPLTFCLDKEAAIDTLEAVLAIARRGGLRLSRLHLTARETDDLVCIELLASEHDLLDLFEHRLRNLVNVFNIEQMRE